MGEAGQNVRSPTVLTFAWPSQANHAGPRIKQEKSQGDGECCICLSCQFMTLTFEFSGVKSPGFCRDTRIEEKLPGPNYFDEVDVGGADDDGGPDGGHAQPVVNSRIAEVDHQVIVPLHHPHREARLKSNPSNSETSRQIMTSASFTTLQIQCKERC